MNLHPKNRNFVAAKLDPGEARRRQNQSCRNYYAKTKDRRRAKVAAYKVEHYKKNKAKIQAYKKEYQKKNSKRLSAISTEYAAKNKAKISEYMRQYRSKRRRDDPAFRLVCNLRTRVYCALRGKGTIRSIGTMKLVGCSIEFLRGYLEAKFEIGMTWENAGEWHVDHIIPCAAFDLSDPAQQLECFNFSNLQPLWGLDNIRKSNIRPDGTRARFVKVAASTNLDDY